MGRGTTLQLVRGRGDTTINLLKEAKGRNNTPSSSCTEEGDILKLRRHILYSLAFALLFGYEQKIFFSLLVGFVLVGSLCPFLREALADKSQKKRSYLLDPLEISTTFIYFAIITIVVVIIIIIISHG